MITCSIGYSRYKAWRSEKPSDREYKLLFHKSTGLLLSDSTKILSKRNIPGFIDAIQFFIVEIPNNVEFKSIKNQLLSDKSLVIKKVEKGKGYFS